MSAAEILSSIVPKRPLAAQPYSIEGVAKQWEALLRSVVTGPDR